MADLALAVVGVMRAEETNEQALERGKVSAYLRIYVVGEAVGMVAVALLALIVGRALGIV